MIDYTLIADSLQFYEGLGYTRIEVPWVVSRPISDLTRPVGVLGHDIVKGDKEKTFIGSGEQGFLYLAAKSHLAPGKYVTATPCLRNDTFDEIHTKYFVKTELIHVGTFEGLEAKNKAVWSVMADAKAFFRKHLTDDIVREVTTEDTIDLEYRGIELGSYGYRSSKICEWIFGTGIAEPRFSRVARYYGTLR